MELTTVQQILLIILTSAFAVLLVISIIATVLVIKVLKAVRIVANKAEKVVESAEVVGEIFKKSAGPIGLLQVLQNLLGVVTKYKKSRK